MELKKAHGEEHENDERWLITYADLITLLMVFFLVMYSMSRTDAVKFKAMAKSLGTAFGTPTASATGIGGQPVTGNSILPNKAQGDSRSGTRNQKADGDVRTRRIQALKSDLDALMEKRGLSSAVTTKVDPKGPKLVMELSDSLLFDAGSADLTPAAVELLIPVGEVLGVREYNIHVEGHTDNVPISGRYKNNFELSAARAVNVIMTLTETAGLPAQLFSASGYGEYRPIAPNDTPEDRAKNRRVDFVIYDENALDSMLGSAMSDGSTQDEPSADGKPAASGQDEAPLVDAHATTAPLDEHAAPGPDAHAAAPALAPPATDAISHAETTHAPTLDTHVSTHADAGQDASHSLSDMLALPAAPAH